MGISTRELEALWAISGGAGKAVPQRVARRMKISAEYARRILTSLASRGYLDFIDKGSFAITPKGEDEMNRRRRTLC